MPTGADGGKGGEKMPIYLDYNGTTPVDKEVADAMLPFMYQHWGNPSSTHPYGLAAKRGLETARAQTAALIGALPEEVTFMSNGTETINHSLFGLAAVLAPKGPREPLPHPPSLRPSGTSSVSSAFRVGRPSPRCRALVVRVEQRT